MNKYKLEEICDFYAGTGFPTIYQGNHEGKYPFYKVGDISKNSVAGYSELTLCDNYIDDDVLKQIKGNIIPPHTVVFAKIGEALKLNRRGLTTSYCLVDNNVMGVFPHQELDYKYFYHFMKTVKMQDYSNATTLPAVKKSEVGKIKIPLPSLPEQQKIAHHLDTIQSAIDNKKQQLQQLDELVKSKFVEMFGENPVENGKWKVEKLDTLVQVTSSKRIYAEEQTDSGIPFLRISDLVSRINGLEQAELYISYEKYNEFSKKGWVPTKDDILVTTRGTLGLCYIIREDDEFYFQDGMITWLKFDNHEKVLSVFICYLFAYVLSPKFNIKSNGATVKYLSISDLKVEKIPVPPIELQNDFATFVQKIDTAKSIIKTQLANLQELLDSKMDGYFGE